MADDTFGGSGGKDNDVHVGGTSETEDHDVATATYPGHAIALDATGKVVPATITTGAFYGAAGVPQGADPDSEIAVSTPCPVYKKGSGAVVWMWLLAAAGPIPVKGGDVAVLTATVGQVALADESTVAAKEGEKVGIIQNIDPGHATDMHLIRVKI